MICNRCICLINSFSSRFPTKSTMRIPENINEDSAVREQLSALGYRATATMPFKVATVVMKLNQGALPWTLFTKRTGHMSALSSKTVVERVMQHLESGELEWLVDLLLYFEETKEESNEAFYEASASGHFDNHHQPLSEARLDPDRYDRLEHCRQALKECPYSKWTFIALTKMGFSSSWALDTLNELLALDIEKARAIITPHDITYDKQGLPISIKQDKYMTDWKGYTRYLELLYTIVFKGASPEAPTPYVEKASHLHVRGVVEYDQGVRTVAIDVLRFAIWEGSANWDAFIQSTKRFVRAPSWEKRFMKQLTELFSGPKEEPEEQTWYMTEYLKRKAEEAKQ